VFCALLIRHVTRRNSRNFAGSRPALKTLIHRKSRARFVLLPMISPDCFDCFDLLGYTQRVGTRVTNGEWVVRGGVVDR